MENHFKRWKVILKKNVLRYIFFVQFLILLTLGCGNNLFAAVDDSDLQQQAVRGTVTDSQTGEAMPGVNIVVRGTTTGAVTDVNGRYSISVPDPNAVLVFSFIGYVNQEAPVGGRSVVDIALVSELLELEEVVVVGYSTQTRKSLTGAVSAVSAEALAKETSSNAINRLQGKASGVDILTSRAPGASATITIRGLGTINNNSPLFVIDGVPTKSGISQINPDEIESLTVLKDASSAAIYGARGANGVIIVTTKHGASGRAKISFSARTALSNFNNWYDLANTQEFGEIIWLEAKNMGLTPSSPIYGNGTQPRIPDYIQPVGAMEGDPGTNPSTYNYSAKGNFNNIMKANKEGTNWFKEITHTGVMQEYNLGISGGTENASYAVNLGYLTEKGIVKYTSFDRYSLRSNASAKATKWLTVGESLGLTFSNGKGQRQEGHEWTPIGYCVRMISIIPVYDIKGNLGGAGFTPYTANGPYAEAYNNRDDYEHTLRGLGNVFAEAQIIEGLRFKSLFGFDYLPFESKNISRAAPQDSGGSFSNGLSMSNSTSIQWNWTNTLNFTRLFADVHRVSLLLGTEAVSSTYTSTGGSRTSFFSEDVNYMYLSVGEANQTNSGSGSQVKWMSYFGRFNYDFKEKYLFEATFRRDGSSRFGANSRWGNFPAFSAAWRISQENFMANTSNFINDLKIRAGWGQSGNDEVGNYNGFSTFSSDITNASYPITGSTKTPTVGFYATTFGNPDAKWETTTTTNIGLDIAVLKNTLSATIDVWQRKTSDMLYRVSIPMVNGAASAPSVNIGDMNNKGIDLNIDYRNKALGGDLTYNVGLTLSRYKNEIEKISGKETEYISGSAFRYMVYTRAQAGSAYPEFYGLICDGIFQTNEEAQAYYPEYGGAYNIAGHFKYRDLNGDEVINDKDRTYIGSPHPKFTAGLNADVSYKNFTLSAFFYSRYGNKIANYLRRFYDFTQFSGQRSKLRLYKSWGSPYLEDNKDAEMPLADQSTYSMYPSTYFLEDGSFLRLRTLQLSYTLPKTWSQKMTFSRMEAYVQASNLFTLTKYNGLDPEISVGGIDAGVDASQWPNTRQVVFGIRLDI